MTIKKSTKEEQEQVADREFLKQTIIELLEGKREKSLASRRNDFGMAADCELVVVGRLAAIIVDNPLPDDDMAILVTNVEKIIDLGIGGIGKRFQEESKGIRFFEESD